MPEFQKYIHNIQKLWETRWLSNNGEFLLKLEKSLEERFQTNCVLVNNGTLGLLISLELFGFPANSEIITTPFSFIATSSSILWQKYKPVFVDIDISSLNIDPKKIVGKITSKTVAIMPVHVFGNPCEIEEIQYIAEKFNLKVIYDAAHCFDICYEGKSIYKFGDVSVASFHATKVFHTIEGGAIFSDNKSLIDKAKKLRNFGFNEKIEIEEVGINAKMNEFQAIMGLLNLEVVDEEISLRKEIYELYLEELKGTNVSFQKKSEKITKYNYIYLPVIFENENIRNKIFDVLKEKGINARKYFYPSLNELRFCEDYKGECPVSSLISRRILQLPLYGELKKEEVLRICKIIRENLD
ncbi:MAG: DegT/DnrJ/EryC1/StrS family aminotransferase [Brevinematia bacterium]